MIGSDLTLVRLAQQGDRAATEELVRRHRDRAEHVALAFFVPGTERDDLRQEAIVGLLRAIRWYRPEVGQPFENFFPLCVYRWLVTCLRESQRDKHRTLNDSRRIDLDPDGELVAISELLPDPRADVPRQAEARAELLRIIDAAWAMSELERVSLVGIAWGYSYDEIQRHVDVTGAGRSRWRKPLSFKGADNAIQRARHKLREAA